MEFLEEGFLLYICLCAVSADRVITTGLAPDIPEDLYMLIKKVSAPRLYLAPLADVINNKYRLSPSGSTLTAIARTRTPSSASF